MHRHLPYPEDGDALFHGTKEKWQGKGNQHNRCAIFCAGRHNELSVTIRNRPSGWG